MQPLQQLQQLWTSLMLIPASPEAVAALPDVDPLLAWGVLTRGLGVVYAIAFASIAVQIRGLAGRDGMSPFAPMMQQMAHDFPGWRRLLYFPTLLWLTGGGDAALVGLPVAGVGFGLAAAYGGAASPLAIWTVDDEPSLRRCFRVGPDDVVSNRPRWARRSVDAGAT